MSKFSNIMGKPSSDTRISTKILVWNYIFGTINWAKMQKASTASKVEV